MSLRPAQPGPARAARLAPATRPPELFLDLGRIPAYTWEVPIW